MLIKVMALTLICLLLYLIAIIIRQKQLIKLRGTIIYIVCCTIIVTSAVFILFRNKSADNNDDSSIPDIIEVDREDDNRIMDMIVWYDIDISKYGNTRPAGGWYTLYPGYPDEVNKDGIYRSATPLLGLYDQKDARTAKQHLYWISALGCNAIACDWTNFSKYTEGTDDTNKYYSGLYNNTSVLLEQAIANKDVFETPTVFVALRLYGDNYDALQKAIDEVYTLYEAYSEKWYKFNDGTNKADKPFLMIFADHTYLHQWEDQGYVSFDDQRFNIRWTNGSIATGEDDNGNHVMKLSNYWSFWDCIRNDDGSYETAYSKGTDGSVEQMSCWASVHLGGMNWDSLMNTINGYTTFERTLLPVMEMKPKALLVARFNYPMAWRNEPQEGVSLLGSTHIEPCNDLGFQVFNNVRNNLYKVNSWNTKVCTPAVISKTDNSVFLNLSEFPTEYRISLDKDNMGEWIYYNINDGISVNDEMKSGVLFIQVRNSFGESEIIQYEIG